MPAPRDLWPLALLGVILAADALLPHVHSTAAAGIVDEAGHMSTGALVLGAAAAVGLDFGGSSLFVGGVLVGSVLIDVDHVPSVIFHWNGLTHGTPRPALHSLLTAFVLLASAAAVRRRSERAMRLIAGLAVGVIFHFVRDLSVPAHVGVSLLRPFSDHAYASPGWAYLAVVTLLALTAIGGARGARTP